MSVTFTQTPGPTGAFGQTTGFSHAVSIPATARLVMTSGQAGCDLSTGDLVTTSPRAQIEAAFDCVEAALKSAGVTEGLRGTHKIISYFVDLGLEPLMMEVWRERCPGHRPTWTAVGVKALVDPGMVVEIAAEATVL